MTEAHWKLGVGGFLEVGSWALGVDVLEDMNVALLLKGGRVVDPANGIDGTRDVLIEGGVVSRVGTDLPAGSAQVVDVGVFENEVAVVGSGERADRHVLAGEIEHNLSAEQGVQGIVGSGITHRSMRAAAGET